MNSEILLNSKSLNKPAFRRLKAYAFDPSLSLKMDTVEINNIIYKIPWEDLEPGPIGEYLEIIDYDPTVGKFYTPVDLNETIPLAQDGYEPSESNPQFHQQMLYAVIMTTIKNFEQALGRKILWSPRFLADYKKFNEYVPRLRVYPHAMREANAFYSPLKKALLFGYFASTPANASLHMPDSLVFAALDHDIIAHETTHAILDGIHGYYNEPTNPDVLAFHEAFADIVALFQHFTFPVVLKHQIAKTRGDLASQNLLGELAQEFGSAIGNYGSLRDAIGEIDPVTKQWKPKVPSPDDYRIYKECHARGSILVSSVFEAFLNIYKSRVADLLRIASNGTSILPEGELQVDLVNRLAKEASKAAKHVLNMCIRAIDYCPPVDITFGDYLRAIITADVDIVDDDSRDYRLAFIDAFRKRGIYPEGIKTLSVESLIQPAINLSFDKDNNLTSSGNLVHFDQDTTAMIRKITDSLKKYANDIKYINDREEIFEWTKNYIKGSEKEAGLHERLSVKLQKSSEFEKITGLAFLENPSEFGIRWSTNYNGPSFQIQNLRLISRVGPDNKQINYVLFSILQRSGVLFKNGEIAGHFEPPSSYVTDPIIPEGGMIFRGGCTLIFDLDSSLLKYAIGKPLLEEDENGELKISKRVKIQYDYQQDEYGNNFNEYKRYFCDSIMNLIEPFNFLHQ